MIIIRINGVRQLMLCFVCALLAAALLVAPSFVPNDSQAIIDDPTSALKSANPPLLLPVLDVVCFCLIM